jgi:hypothetical protein
MKRDTPEGTARSVVHPHAFFDARIHEPQLFHVVPLNWSVWIHAHHLVMLTTTG